MEFLRGFWIPFTALDELQKAVILKCSLRILVRETKKILARYDIGHVVVLLPSNLVILVQDGLVGLVLVNSAETVIETANIDNATGQTETATAFQRQCDMMD